MADKRLTYVLTARDDASSSFAKVAAAAKASGYDISKSYKQASDDSKLHISALTAALAGVAPAAIPIGAVAVGAIAGLGATAGVAVLGVLGIRDAMKEGTILGRQYEATFKPITTEFTTLKQLAAQNMFAGINAAVKNSQTLFPTLNRDVGKLSTQVGDIVGNVGPGLVALFHDINPLLVDLGDALVGGSAKFKTWATSSDGVKKFVGYAQNELPKVETTLGNIATAAGHIVQGLAPLGTTSLSTIGLFAKMISGIPVGVLQGVLPTIGSLVIGLKGLEAARGASASLDKLAAKGGAASGALGGLSKVVGFMGPVGVAASIGVGILSSVLGNQAQKQAEATAQVNSYTQALQASNGVIDENIRQLAAKNLQDAGAFDAATKLGLGLDTVTSAALGNQTALDQVNATLAPYTSESYEAWKASGLTEAQFLKLHTAAGKVSGALGQQSGELDKAKTKQQQLAAANSSLNATTTTLAGTQQSAKIKIDGVTTSITKETTASGLLKNALDRLNGTAVSVEQTQNQFLDTLAGLTKRSKDYNGNLSQLNATGRANREVIVSAIQAANQHAQAIADQTAKTKGLAAGVRAGSTDLHAHENAIRGAAAAAGLDKSQVDALIRSIGRIPRVVNTTIHANGVVNADRDVQSLLSHINALHSKNITIDYYETVHTIGAPNAGAGGHLSPGPPGHASGTDFFAGGMTWINEQGPELVQLPAGTKINTASRTKEIMAGAGGGDINVYVQGSVVTAQDLARDLIREINVIRKRRGAAAI